MQYIQISTKIYIIHHTNLIDHKMLKIFFLSQKLEFFSFKSNNLTQPFLQIALSAVVEKNKTFLIELILILITVLK